MRPASQCDRRSRATLVTIELESGIGRMELEAISGAATVALASAIFFLADRENLECRQSHGQFYAQFFRPNHARSRTAV